MADSLITKKALAQAMKELMHERSFMKISVGDICDKCNMNRKSFYYHFKDKYELVNWIYFNEFVGAVSGEKSNGGWGFFEDACRYFYDNREFYTNALEVSGQNSFRDYFRELLQPAIFEQVEYILSEEEESEFFSCFFTDAILVAIMRWLTTEPCMKPEKFTGLMRRAFIGVAKDIIKKEESTNNNKSE